MFDFKGESLWAQPEHVRSAIFRQTSSFCSAFGKMRLGDVFYCWKFLFFFYYYHIVLFSGVSTGLGRKGGRLKRERCYLTVLCYTMSVVTMFFDGVTVWMRASLFILYWRNLRDRFFIGAAVFFFRRWRS